MENLYDLLKIGLTEGEAKVYLALSKLGSSTVGPVVKDSGVAYSNIYDILNRLIEKGIVSFIIKSKTKYFQACSPVNLLEYLDKKEKKLHEEKENLKKILPELEKLQESREAQEAEIFLGTKGLRTAYEKLYRGIHKDEEIYFFYIHKKEYAEQSNLFYNSLTNLAKGVKNKGICNKEYKKSWFSKIQKHLTLKYVNFPIPGNIDISKNKVFIVSWQPAIVGILIHSESIASLMREYFEEVWKIAKA
jgi:HTH-type transcriptional regulator, sugar sensing transcriptional regulator